MNIRRRSHANTRVVFRRTELARRGLHLALYSILLLALMTVATRTQADTRWQAEREQFRQAWSAAGRGDLDAVGRAIEQLPDYPLTPFLEFERYRQTIDHVDPLELEQFLARYRDWSFADRLERDWQRSLVRNNNDEVLLRYVQQPSQVEVQCALIRANIRLHRLDGLEEQVRSLWLNGRSQPRSCDPVFRWWRNRGNPDVDDAWRRFGLAVEAGEYSLARYLRRYLHERDELLADGWLKMAQRLNDGLSDALRWPDAERSRQLIQWGLYRLSSRDWQRATAMIERFDDRFDFAEGDLDAVKRRAALFQAVDLDENAVASIDALPSDQIDQQMLEWRLRASLITNDWNNVLSSIAAMNAEEQIRGRWRYWRARALAELSRPEAGLVYATLATEPHYYGFLAALKSNQALTVCSRELTADGPTQLRLLNDAEFERALELFEAGLNHHARITWNQVSRRISSAELQQAALIAAGRGWHDRAIFALGNAGIMDAYAWRFPIIERERVERYAERYGVEPALVFGLMRAESAMQADARSAADARGLLQLIDGTARSVARRKNLSYNGPASLYQPAINIPLGIAHLGELQERFDGEWTRVAAAYNAGITPTTRWQGQRNNLATDIWLETLPFFETRDYVPRVLAFATIYEYRMRQDPRVLAAYVLHEHNTTAMFECSL
ncbi:MAG: transglycosylase SLT domain-containing protein [Pseudomonadota bacterium]